MATPRQLPPPELAKDPHAAARTAGLRYVTDTAPGIRRRKAGKGFNYVGPNGNTIRNRAELARIRSLAIPPAYTDVWICPLKNGHIQATGRDARGRKQYRYHPRWREVRDETKYSRMLAFSEVIPRIRSQVDRDLAQQHLTRKKVMATVVRLLECTGIRVGNDEYAKANNSYGLTTLKDQHVDISGSTLRFEFRGKSGKQYRVSVNNRRLARIVQRCQSLPGQELFQYLDEDGRRQVVSSEDVNQYLRDIGHEDFTSKDFRTWVGTNLAVTALKEIGPCRSSKQAKSNILRAIDKVSEQLNNTRAICRKYYVHPAILETYEAGTMLELLQNGTKQKAVAGLRSEEVALIRLLRHQLVANSKV
jgi:DNA topoisomerase-1